MSYRADIIRAEKAAQKKTIDDLVNETGLNSNTISDICSGKSQNPELNTLQLIASALNLDMETIFSARSRTRLAA